MRNRSIAIRLTAVLVLITALLLATALSSAWPRRQFHQAGNAVSDNGLPSVDVVNKMNSVTSDLHIGEFQHLANTDDKAMARLETDKRQMLAELDKQRAA